MLRSAPVAEHLFFDLDGTLTDPQQGIVTCFQHALKELGREAPEHAELLQCIGPPLHVSFEALVGGALAHQAVTLYRERFATVGLYENRLYADVEVSLGRMARAGHRMWVVTSKPEVFARRIVEHFGIGKHFEDVYGPDLDGTRADKTELIAHALTAANLPAAHTVMLGDRRHDVVGARNNGVRAVGALWGYGTEAELTQAGAQQVYGCMSDFTESLMQPPS